ncbi:MAG: dTDP-4-dehydrorhamnose reductase [Candidatus Aquicultorales bacterium]
MKILVTGAKGMLGTELTGVLSGSHQVIGADLDEFDITDVGATKRFIADTSPDLVLHAAAFTDVDGCETDPETAFTVNTLGTQNVALGCRRAGAALLLFSTDFVFDGRASSPYIEWDQPKPISVYGATKYAAERVVAHVLWEYYIVRIAWLYGAGGSNFVKTMLRLGSERDMVSVVTDQVGSPTYAKDVALGVSKLIETGNYGIYHMVNTGRASWNEFAKEIYRLRGMNVEVRAITGEELGRPAKRPAFSVLRNFVLEKTIGNPMRPWKEALAEFLANEEA